MGGFYFPLIWGTVFDVQWYDESNRRLNLVAFDGAVEYLKQIYDTPGYDLISSAGIGGWTGGVALGPPGDAGQRLVGARRADVLSRRG